MMFPNKNFKNYFGLHTLVIFLDHNICSFWHICMLVVGLTPNSIGQLAKLIVHTIPLRKEHKQLFNMMTSSNGNIFRVTGHSCGEFTGPR